MLQNFIPLQEWGDTLFSVRQGWNVRISFSWLKSQGLEKYVQVLTLVHKGVHLDPFFRAPC